MFRRAASIEFGNKAARVLRVTFVLIALAQPRFAIAQSFDDYPSYCRAMAEIATPVLEARILDKPKEFALQLMEGMTDAKSIRMVHEEIDFAYSQSTTTTIEQMRA